MRKKTVIRFFICYRIFGLILSLYVISKMTGLGDYNNYINSDFFYELELGKYYLKNTHFIKLIIGFFKEIFFRNIFILNLFFNILSSYLIIKFLEKVRNNKVRTQIYLICLFPSFTIWTSYISKENLYITFSCMTLIYILKLKNKENFSKKEKLFFIFAIFLTIRFKIQYSLYWIGIILFFCLKRKLLNKKMRYFIYLIILLIILFLSYYFREKVDMFFKDFHRFFREDAGSTRNLTFFKERFGFYKNMIYGTLIAFYGPTIKELMRFNLLVISSFVESFFLVMYIFYSLMISKKFYKGVYIFIIIILLISHYPFGVFNSGSAIRYRSSLIIPIIVLPYLLEKNTKKLIKIE